MDDNSFKFYPDETNKLVSVLPDKRVAVFTNEDFKQLLKNNEGNDIGNQFITLKTLDKVVETTEDFTEIVNGI